jgi:3-hydroxy-3-methylglutaryl CoA synthase/uncharacterized OB-fold protein
MPGRYVRNVGVYLPLLRLERNVAAAALGWTGLGGLRSGRRAIANWDEDALTMAVEAGRTICDGAPPRSVTFASTSSIFRERLQAALVIEALNLDRDTAALDVSGARRCGVGALRRALLEGTSDTLIVAGERRRTAAGSAMQLAWGDGGAAVLTSDNGIARLIGEASLSFDFVDFYTSESNAFPYQYEERFVKDEAVALILKPAVGAACSSAGISAADISIAIVQEPVSGTYKALAASLGMPAPNLAERVAHEAGDLGAAHAIFGLGLALEQAKEGDKILVAAFGSGCDAIVLDVVNPACGSTRASTALSQGAPLANYLRFLSLAGSLDLDWGPRSELDQKTSASVLARHGRDMHGFVGGRDVRGNVQFPKTAVPVSPDASGPEMLEDVPLADVPARTISITADRLSFTPDPPFHFGLVQFDNGARVGMEFCDVEGMTPNVGDAVRMRFRVKSIDRKRGFRSYFWKAAPKDRPLLQGT